MMRVRDPDHFARRLAATGLTQNRLADDLELSRGYLSEVARGQRRINDLDAELVAFKLGVDAADLFDREGDPVPPARRAVQERLVAEMEATS